MTVLQLSLKLILLIGVGFAARKLKVMGDGFDRQLSRFLMDVPLPCMIIHSFHIDFSPERLLSAPILLGLSVGSMALLFLLVWLCTARMRDRALRKTVRFALLFTNFTFMGLPVVGELYGQEAVFHYVIFTLPIRIIFYGGASLLLGKGGERVDVKETLKRFFCAPVVAVFIGFGLYAAQIQLPALVTDLISTLGSMASPLGLLLCGVILADADWRGIWKRPVALLVAVLRLTLIPGLVLGLFLLLGVEHSMIRSCIFYFAMPVASFLPTFLLRYDPEAVEARSAAGCMVVLSTLLCVLSIPAWTLLLEKLG